MTPACRSECLNGKVLSFLHLGVIIVLDKEDRLSSMDLVPVDRMSAEVGNRLYCMTGLASIVSWKTNTRTRVGLSIYFDLVGLHGFLDVSAQFAQTHVDPSFLSTPSAPGTHCRG